MRDLFLSVSTKGGASVSKMHRKTVHACVLTYHSDLLDTRHAPARTLRLTSQMEPPTVPYWSRGRVAIAIQRPVI